MLCLKAILLNYLNLYNICVNFVMHAWRTSKFTVKTDFINMSETSRFRRKIREKSSQSAQFVTFFFKNIYWKMKNANRFFIVKNKCINKFYVLTIKSALGNMSECSEFRVEKSLELSIRVKLRFCKQNDKYSLKFYKLDYSIETFHN